MPQAQRSSDIIEEHSEKALSFGLGGLIGIAISGVLYYFRGEGTLLPFTYVIAFISASALIYAIFCALQVRRVTGINVDCPYCKGRNRLVEMPESDFSCIECHRMIPVERGALVRVHQVRCGYCNELNFYSDKTQVLLCESCNHEIPISQADGQLHTKHIAKGFAVQDDENLYELVLVAYGQHKTEDLIGVLQHMLALNRNQVKDILENLPTTLLTGITRKKAEMLAAQLSIHEAAAEFHPVQGAPVS
jgi:hypothetical protein